MSLRSKVRIAIGILMVGAGIAHFIYLDFFATLVPESLGAYRQAFNVGTGFLQIAMGFAFWLPRFRAVARWSTVALLVLSLPAAVDQVIHPAVIESLGMTPGLAAVRVVVQILMIGVVWWATAPETQSPAGGGSGSASAAQT